MQKHVDELIGLIEKAAKNRSLLTALLKDMLSAHELQEVAQRWQIVKLLDAGEKQHDVAEKLKVGVATVGRGAKTLLNPHGGFNQLLQSLRGRKKG